ncbi:hypothetical protein ACFFX1_54775 [Dactylosporangium sucinum]|uniref:hypothetical protein n=1 Tax=Dactylosporangium sucinum TaxID=1424081 RepID=UPI0035711F07
MVDDLDRREDVPVVGVAEVGRLLQEHGPRVEPQVELGLFVRVQREVVRLGGVPLEEPGECLAGVHDAEEPGVVDELLVPVGAGGGGGNESVLDLVEQGQERLVGLGPERAEDGRLVEAGGVEQVRVKPAVADGLVVGEVDAGPVDLVVAADESDGDAEHGGVADELLPHAEGADDEGLVAGVVEDKPERLQLHHRLAEAERGEDRAPAAVDSPADDGCLVGFEERVDVGGVDVEAVGLFEVDLVGEEVEVGIAAVRGDGGEGCRGARSQQICHDCIDLR